MTNRLLVDWAALAGTRSVVVNRRQVCQAVYLGGGEGSRTVLGLQAYGEWPVTWPLALSKSDTGSGRSGRDHGHPK
jgi:hypothetical protein